MMHPQTIAPRIAAIGTANPPDRYTQEQFLDLFRVDDPRARSLFRNSHIESRHLYLPPANAEGYAEESPEALIGKHLRGVLDMGARAVGAALDAGGLAPGDIDQLVTVTSTGFLCPGISAHLVRAMGFRTDVHRLDIIGMGCNAALNGLAPAAAYAGEHPGARSLLLCCEVCSAAYVHDDTMRTAVVNSLFGDGAAAAVLATNAPGDAASPSILGFESHIIPEAIDAMRFDTVGGKLSFFLDRNIPYVIGNNVRVPVMRLLERFGLKQRNVAHWLVHSGGKKVIDSIKYNLGLTNHDVRHTRAILRRFGNLSSASVLFSLARLRDENVAKAGDHGVMIAMGPGTSIETALLRW